MKLTYNCSAWGCNVEIVSGGPSKQTQLPILQVVRLTLSRSEIALVVCLKSASAAVVIAVSLPATRSVVDAVLGILVEQLVSLFEPDGD